MINFKLFGVERLMCVCVFVCAWARAWSGRGVEWPSLGVLKPPKI